MPLADFGLLDPLASAAGALVDDSAVLAALVEVEAALTASWADLGLAPVIVDLESARLDLPAIARGNRAGGNPVIPLVTQLRAYADAESDGAGDWVHRGATSQDILDTALMLVASRAVAAARGSLADAAETVAALADRHRHDLMVGRTLATHAAPITFGTKASSWLDGVLAGLRALDSLVLPVQLAGAVGTGSSFGALAEAPSAGADLRAGLARRLALADPGRSWQAERSPVAALGSALALALGALGRIAAEVLVLGRNEIAEVSEGSGGGSSAMPQKQNPTSAVLLHSAALQAPGLLATVHSSLVTEDERPSGAWHAEWLALRSLLRLAVEASETAATMLSALTVDAARMRSNLDLDGGLAWAEQAQSQLTPELGRAAANALVSRAIGAVAPGLPFGAALATELDGQVVDLSDESVFATADPVVDAALEHYRSRGEK
jgi:3-carboxy-cis,cis-muconate cycloisomerase